MRWFLLALLGFVGACGGTTKDPVASGTSGAASSGGGDLGGGPSAGAGAGGTAASSGAGDSGSASGGSDHGNGEGGGGGAAPLVDCDARKVLCKRVAPECATFEVPSVEGACYGECVKIERCACVAAEECPDSNQFTCWAKTHCGPFVR
jgi:hypothetical protein